MSEIPKISVIIITYNQEKLISRAIDSVLSQLNYVYEIIVSDDCSSDSTWGVVLEYQRKYPTLIKPFRHPINLGIFKNLESTWDKPSGNLMIYLAGDDIICDGLLYKVTTFVNKNAIGLSTQSFAIYTDSKCIMPSGHEHLRSNKLVQKGYDVVSLKVRNLIGSSRGIVYSKELFRRFRPVAKEIGIFKDGLYDIQVQLNSEHNYYIDFVGGVYFGGIGVSFTTPAKERVRSLILLYDELLNFLNLDERDKHYILMKKEYYSFIAEPVIGKVAKYCNYFFKSIKTYSIIAMIDDFKLIFKMLILLIKHQYQFYLER